MGIKTEDFVKNLPSKEMTAAAIDWLGILDSFDPTTLEENYINECARRNPYDTCYRWDEDGLPSMPIEGRMRSSDFERRDLINCISRIEIEGLTPVTYKNARAALIKAIGHKGAMEYNRREYERLGEEGRRKQAEQYEAWMINWERQRAAEATEYGDYRYGEPSAASVHEKVVKIRKGVPGSNGRPLIQRDFAKFIGYPINKYAEAERTDRYGRSREPESVVDYELLEKLIMICHANPYWLFDDECEAYYAEYDLTGAAGVGDAPCVFAAPDIILRWIEAGKPRTTCWEDGLS